MGCILLGATILMLPNSPVPVKITQAMVEDSCVNIEALFEDYKVKERAVYYPPKQGRVFAFAPFTPGLTEESLIAKLKDPLRVHGENGLMVFPPGSKVVRFSIDITDLDIEEAVYDVLVNIFEAADGVKVIQTGNIVHVQLFKPRIKIEFPRFIQVLGSLPISIAGCVLATVFNKPVAYDGEELKDSTVTATFRLLANG